MIIAPENTQRRPKKRKKSKMKRPYWAKNILRLAHFSGKKEKRIWEPSRGGIGIKLKMAKIKFKITIIPNMIKMGMGNGKNLMARPKIKATKIFDPGPAMATLASSHFGFRKL